MRGNKIFTAQQFWWSCIFAP